MKSHQVSIVNFGSQYTALIERTIRSELYVRSAILPPRQAEKWLATETPRAIILSGSESSVNEADAPHISDAIFNAGVPILGICYGMQWLAHRLGGQVTSGTGAGNYGSTEVQFPAKDGQGLWDGFACGAGYLHHVWASHGDLVTRLPEGFTKVAWEDGNPDHIMAMADAGRKIWGVQFHPEVRDTDNGPRILSNFIFGIAGCDKDWDPEDIAGRIREEVAREVGDASVIGGFSGGVDSTTAFKLLSPVLGDRLHPVTLNAGQLRNNELSEICRNAEHAGVNRSHWIYTESFVPLFADTINPEAKRLLFRHGYNAWLQSEADRRPGVKFVLQGTIAPDLIESGKTGGALIVSHHNAGLTFHGLKEIAPFSSLFKYEIRALARSLGLPEEVCERQPSPGPGQFVRIVGKPVTEQRLAVLNWAEEEVKRITMRSGDYAKVSQLVVAMLCVEICGVKGDGPSRKPSIAVRGIVTADFMTGRGYQLPPDVRREIDRILTKHAEIGAVGFYEGNKPPNRTEFE